MDIVVNLSFFVNERT